MKRIILTLLFFITHAYALTDSNAKSSKNKSKWSDYQGIMTWDEAKAKCISLGMRLPTKAEFKIANTAKETKKWNTDIEKDNDVLYWTSEEDHSESPPYLAYYFDKGNGNFYREFKTIPKVVRCIR